MPKYFTDIDDIVPGKEHHEAEDLQNYLLEHSYRDGMEPPPDEKVLFYNGLPIGSRGNIIAINGKAKSRKSVIASAIMSSAFTADPEGFLGFTTTLQENPKVLNFDTEQGLGHWIDGSRRVVLDAGLSSKPEGFQSHHTRECDVDKRIALFEFALRLYRPDIAVLDGITDVVYDLNSQEEATRIGGKLMRWSVEFNCLIICIIHITKGTGYMTGALGSYLEKKCQTALKCEKDEKNEDVSWVTCQYARDKGFPMFGIMFDDVAGHYVRLDEDKVHQIGPGSSNGPGTKSDEFKAQFLNAIFRVHSAFNIKQHFRTGIKTGAAGLGIPNMHPKDVTAWFDYFLSTGDVMIHPEQGYMRGEVVQAAKAISPEIDFTAQVEDHTSDDLPF